MAQKRKQKKGKSKRWLYWAVMVFLFVGAAAICYFVWDAYFRVKDNGGDKRDEKVLEDAQQKEGKSDEGKVDDSEDPVVLEKEKVVQYEGGDPNDAEELTGVVTYAGVSGDVLIIRTNIDQYLADGKCELTLNRGGTIYNSIANIMSSVATSACDGFDVPVAELGGGEIEININLSADGRVGSLHGKANI